LLKWLPQPEAKFSDSVISAPEVSKSIESTNAFICQQLSIIEGLDVETGWRNMRGDLLKFLHLLQHFHASHGEDASNLSFLLD